MVVDLEGDLEAELRGQHVDEILAPVYFSLNRP